MILKTKKRMRLRGSGKIHQDGTRLIYSVYSVREYHDDGMVYGKDKYIDFYIKWDGERWRKDSDLEEAYHFGDNR